VQKPPSKNVEKISELHQYSLKTKRTPLPNHLHLTHTVRTKHSRHPSPIRPRNNLINERAPISMPDPSLDEIEKEEHDIYSPSFIDDVIQIAKIIIEMLAVARVIVKIGRTSFCTKYAR
jgi:hypothetical protein